MYQSTARISADNQRKRRGLLLMLLGGLGICSALPASGQGIFKETARASGLDFVHFNGMSGELYFPELMGSGVALFDYDNDGDLDVYLVQGQLLDDNKVADDAIFPPSQPLPVTDRLYRNDSRQGRTLKFTDVTAAADIRVTSYGMGVVSGDIDNDGWIDLYITAFGENSLLKNIFKRRLRLSARPVARDERPFPSDARGHAPPGSVR